MVANECEFPIFQPYMAIKQTGFLVGGGGRINHFTLTTPTPTPRKRNCTLFVSIKVGYVIIISFSLSVAASTPLCHVESKNTIYILYFYFINYLKYKRK